MLISRKAYEISAVSDPSVRLRQTNMQNHQSVPKAQSRGPTSLEPDPGKAALERLGALFRSLSID